MKQYEQVIEVMRANGGYATLKRLNEVLDFSTWKTKTPEASVRRIVQLSDAFFRIQPGLWALEECRSDVLRRFQIAEGNPKSEEQFSHGYYQGLLVEIGKMQNYVTYVPAQDKNRLFLDKRLVEIADRTKLFEESFNSILRDKARTVDVIWFNNQREMPFAFYEVEHSTDIKNSLSKFYELQDYHADFRIVADICRKREFEDKLHVSMFEPIKSRVRFLSYDEVASKYSVLQENSRLSW